MAKTLYFNFWRLSNVFRLEILTLFLCERQLNILIRSQISDYSFTPPELTLFNVIHHGVFMAEASPSTLLQEICRRWFVSVLQRSRPIERSSRKTDNGLEVGEELSIFNPLTDLAIINECRRSPFLLASSSFTHINCFPSFHFTSRFPFSTSTQWELATNFIKLHHIHLIKWRLERKKADC